jgi:hypothetical protein
MPERSYHSELCAILTERNFSLSRGHLAATRYRQAEAQHYAWLYALRFFLAPGRSKKRQEGIF